MSLWDPLNKTPEAKTPTGTGGLWSGVKSTSVDNAPAPEAPPVPDNTANTGLWSKVTPPVVPKLSTGPQDGAVLSPYQMKTSTPSVLAPGTPTTVDILKKTGKYLFDPKAETNVVPIGYTEESAKKLPPIKGPRIIVGTAKILGDIPKQILQSIPRAYLAVNDAFKNSGESTETPLGPIMSKLSGEDKYKNVNKDIQERLDRGDGILASYLGAISQKTLDVAFGAQIAATGLRTLSNILARPGITAEIEAWKTMGSPATDAELKANFRDLSKQFHPDATGGDDTAFKILNKANSLIEGKIPSTIDAVSNKAAQGAELLGRESSIWVDIAKPDLGIKANPGVAAEPLPFKQLESSGTKSISTESAPNQFIKTKERVLEGKSYIDYEIPNSPKSMLEIVNTSDGYRVRNVEVAPDLRGKGITKNAYEKINTESLQETGKTLRSSVTDAMTPDAKKVWNTLVDEGKAIFDTENDYFRFSPESTAQYKLPTPKIRDVIGRFANKTIHPEDVAQAKDFIDFYDGSYRALSPEAEQNLTQDAFRIAERYGGPKAASIKTTKALANFLEDLTKNQTSKFSRGTKLSGTKLPVADVKKALHEIIPEKDVRLYFRDDLIDGVAEGRYSKSDMNGYKSVLKPVIELYQENGLASLDTAYHEAGHYVLDNFMSKAEKDNFVALAKMELGPMKNLGYKIKGYNRSVEQRAEEYLMDEYAKAKMKGGSYDPKYKTFFQKVDAILKKIVDSYHDFVDHIKKLYKESGEGGYVKNPLAGDEPKPRKMGEVTIGGKKFDITKGGKMDLPVDRKAPAPKKVESKPKDLTPDLEHRQAEIEIRKEEIKNSPFNHPDNRFLVDKEKRVRELGDLKSPKLIKKLEDRIAESGVKDPTKFAEGFEKFQEKKAELAHLETDFKTRMKAKDKVDNLKKDIVKLESFGLPAKNLKQDIARTVEENNLAMTPSGQPLKIGREGIPIALNARQRALAASAPPLLEIAKPVPLVEGEEGEVRSIEIQAREALVRANQENGGDIGAFSLPHMVDAMQTPVNKKINFVDYIFITPDRVLKKVGLGDEAVQLMSEYNKYLKELPLNVDKVTEWSNQVPTESNGRIFDYLDGRAVTLRPNEKRVAMEIKDWLKEWATRLGLPKEEQITHYITHIFDDQLIKKEFDEDLAKIIDQKVPGAVYDPFLQKRLGALGYKRDTWGALDAYVKRATRKVYMDPVLEKIQSKIGSSAELSNVELSQWKYVQRYINNVNLRPSEFDTSIDNWVKASPIGYRLGQRPVARTTRIARQWVSRAMLGLNFGSAMRNLSQGVNTYSKLGEKYTAIGYTKLFSPEARAEIVSEGILGNDMVQDRSMSSTKKFWEKVDKGLYFFFENVEKVNRGAAYLGAKSKFLAENSEKLAEKGLMRYEIEAKAKEYAKKMVRDTQFTFGSIDTPVALQGDIVKTVAQFQSYTTKQIEFLNEMRKNKEWVGLLRYVAGSVAVLYSLGKLYGMTKKEILPIYRIGWPPATQFLGSIGGAVLNTPDAYGRPRTLKKKSQDIGKSFLTTIVPGGTQIRKTFRGANDITEEDSVAGKVKKLAFGKPYTPPKAKDTSPNAVALSDATAKATERRKAFKPTYDKITKLWKDGKTEEAQKAWDGLSTAEQTMFKTISTSEKSAATRETQKDVVDEVQQVMEMIKSGDKEGAKAVWDSLDDAEKKAFTSVYKKLNQ